MERRLNTNFTATNGVSPVLNQIANSANQTISTFGKLQGALAMVGLTVSLAAVVGAVNNCISAYNQQAIAETKLATIMRQRMGANQEMLQSVLNLVTAEQKLGVIGDEVQLAGAQQLATFLNNKSSLEALIPAMNNLAAQQRGYNATQEDMVAYGNLFGKVMQGQTQALRRVGITFTDTQEAMLKTGTEEEKAAILAQVVTDNVGKMNEVLAQTPEGKRVQAMNRFSDSLETMGSMMIAPVNTMKATLAGLGVDFMNNLGPVIAASVTALAEGISVLAQGFSWLASVAGQALEILSPFALILGTMVGTYYALVGVQAVYGMMLAARASVIGILLGLQIAWKAGTIGVTAAQWALNVAMAANPIGLVVGAIVVLIGVMTALFIRTYGLREAFAVAFGAIVDIVQNAVNICIGAINLFIGALNAAAKLSNSVLKTNFGTINTAKTVNFQGFKTEWQGAIREGTVMEKIGDMVKANIPETKLPETMGTGLENIGDNTAKTAENTGKLVAAAEMTDEEIRNLRDVANREAVMSWQQTHLDVTIQNDNNISNDVDIDGMTSNIVQGLRRAFSVVPEGA